MPKAIRDRRNWGEGTQLVVEETEAGVLLKEASVFAPTRSGAAAGVLKHTGKPKTLKEMDEGIVREVRRRHDRSRY